MPLLHINTKQKYAGIQKYLQNKHNNKSQKNRKITNIPNQIKRYNQKWYDTGGQA